MAGMVHSKIIIQPYLYFVISIYAYELSIDMKGSVPLIYLLEGIGGFPKNMQALSEG